MELALILIVHRDTYNNYYILHHSLKNVSRDIIEAYNPPQTQKLEL